jgi:hypothetical protein
MQSKLFLAAKLLDMLAFVFSLFLPPAEGIRETVLHSDTTSVHCESQFAGWRTGDELRRSDQQKQL